MNILRFQPNVPTQVTLQSSQGDVAEGRYGNRMMFSLVDGRVMYVPPIGEDEAKRLAFHEGLRKRGIAVRGDAERSSGLR